MAKIVLPKLVVQHTLFLQLVMEVDQMELKLLMELLFLFNVHSLQNLTPIKSMELVRPSKLVLMPIRIKLHVVPMGHVNGILMPQVPLVLITLVLLMLLEQIANPSQVLIELHTLYV